MDMKGEFYWLSFCRYFDGLLTTKTIKLMVKISLPIIRPLGKDIFRGCMVETLSHSLTKGEENIWKKWIDITRLVSLDTSSTKSGWAVFENGEYKDSGVINLDTSEHKKKYKNKSENRIQDMCLEILHILQKNKPGIIVIEKLNVSRNMNSTRVLSKIIGVVYCYSILNDCFYFEIQPSQWRSKLGMQSSKRGRDEYKRLSIEYIKENIGKDVSDDEADSICAGIGYIKMFDEKEKK